MLPNGGGLAYGELHLDPASLAWLSAKLPEIPDALTRGSAWITLWDAMLDGELPPDALIDLALRALPRETDELNVQQMLGSLREAYWRFTPAERRAALAPRLERVLRVRPRRSPDAEPEGFVLLDAARHGAYARRRSRG